MDQFTIVYIDDALDPGRQTLENLTLYFLEHEFRNQPIRILGFHEMDPARSYLSDTANRCDLLISDQNLWWGRNPNGSHSYRDGNTFVSLIAETRSQIKEIPIVVYTDSPTFVSGRWNRDGIPVFRVVAKYNYDDHDSRECWEILADTVRECFPPSLREGNGRGNAKERHP